jgi:tetratricopeptide (TPR) repeat protein
MLRLIPFLTSSLALSCLLLAGCQVANPDHHGKTSSSAASGKSAEDTRDLQKIAEAHAHYATGIIHEMQDAPEAALEDYYQAALGDPDNELLILEISRRFIAAKQNEKAIEILSRAAARPGASGAIFARLGFVYGQVGKLDQAIAANRVAVNKSPAALVGYQNLFLNYLQNKSPQEALKVLDLGLKQPNPPPEFLIGIAELYIEFARQNPSQKKSANSKALIVLNRAEKLHPANPPLRLKLAEDYVSAGDSSKAAAIYLDLLKTLPDVPMIRERVHARLTDIYLQSDDRGHAQEQLEALVRDNPTNPQPYYFLGGLAYEDKKLAKAEEYFAKTILLNKDFEPAYYELALAQLGQNKSKEAIETLNNARARFSRKFVAEFLSGMAYSRQKEYSEALKHFTEAEIIAKASETNRLDQNFYFQVGATYERQGDLKQAEKYFEKCLELAPDFTEAQNYLGYMWAEHGSRLEQAKELIEKAVAAEPKNAAYLDSMSWVLFKLNQPKDALTYALKAVQLSEEPDATVFDHLGDIYAALNQLDKAREAWEKSLSLEASAEVRKKLDQSGAAK